MIGSLEFDGACFYAQTPRIGRFTVIWPDGFVGRRVAASAELVDPSGPVYKVGDVLRVGGGAFETPPFSDVLTQAHGSLTPVCQVPPYWIGGPVSRD